MKTWSSWRTVGLLTMDNVGEFLMIHAAEKKMG